MPFSFLREAFGSKKEEPRCSFCDRSRLDVRALIARDDKLHICNDCVALSVAAMDCGGVREARRFEFSIQVLTSQLSQLKAPEAGAPSGDLEEEARRLVEAALLLNGGDPEGALQIGRDAAAAQRHRAALQALLSIDEAKRGTAAWTEILVAHYQLGEFEEAWAASEAIDKSELDAGLRALMVQNEAAVRLRLRADLSPAELEELWSELVHARAALQQAYGDAYEDTIAVGLAECELRLGRSAAAEARLMAVPRERLNARGVLVLGDIRAALEDPIGARGRYTEALKMVAEGHPIREELATRLALGKSPYR